MQTLKDVLLVSTDAAAAADLGTFDDPRQYPVDEHVPLHPGLGLSIDRNNHDLAQQVMDGCDPCATENRQWGSNWGFYRNSPPEEKDSPLKWDPDRAIYSAVAMSMLLHPNIVNTQYAARVQTFEGSTKPWIHPGPVQGHTAQTFAHDGVGRLWLTKEDALELATLFQTYWREKDGLPERVRRALWNHDYAVHVHDANIRFVIVATALEGFVHTDRIHSTRQFCRITRLATELGLAFTEQDASDAYDLRSTVAHGSHFATVIPGQYTAARVETLLVAMELLLRAALRRTIEDSAFRAVFAAEDGIRDRWPL